MTAERTRFLLELRRSERRRSLAVEVHADLRVIVRAPARCAGSVIEQFVSSRASWIERQLERFRMRGVRPEPRYAEGEPHRFLGASYRLLLEAARRSAVELEGGRIVVRGPAVRDSARVAAALTGWYKREARALLPALVARWHAERAFRRHPLPPVTVRTMRSRWGSLCPRRGMTLNSLLMRAPLAAIEYVVVHELCHLRYHGHGKGFYRQLEAVLPDWRERKYLLEAGES